MWVRLITLPVSVNSVLNFMNFSFIRVIYLFLAMVFGQALTLFADEPQAPTVIETLKRGGFETYHFVPTGAPRAIILFGSGDGGWGYIENRLCTFLKKNDYCIIGIDCRKYASSDYDAAILISDFQVIADGGLRQAGNPKLPVIYGGWSMGAVQAVAASGSDQRSTRLVGLLLLSMDKRGRYGLRFTDKINISPEGDGTFRVADFSSSVGNLRVVQFEAVGDYMSNSDWIKTLKSPHRLYEVQNSNHDFNGINENFKKQLLDGLNWILNPSDRLGDRQPTAS